MTATEWGPPRAATRRKRRAVAIGSAVAAERRRAAAKGIRLKRGRRSKSAAVANLLNWLGEADDTNSPVVGSLMEVFLDGGQNYSCHSAQPNQGAYA